MNETTTFTSDPNMVDVCELRTEIQAKYAAVATKPEAAYHFHTGRPIAERCRYDMAAVDVLPPIAIESFAGVANPFELRSLQPGENVVDLGSGAGMDCFLAAHAVGDAGSVIGVDMTQAMLTKARSTAAAMQLDNVEFFEGLIEEIPVADHWADAVISNGVINLAPDKEAVFAEIFRALKPGGVLQFADIANGAPVPEDARRQVDLWTG
jgi:arsenite methyltransferase